MLAGVLEAEPDRIWFGRGGCVEVHRDGTFAVFMRGELLCVYDREDVATRDLLIAVVVRQGELTREDVARAFRVSSATVGRVVTRFNEGGLRSVADYGRTGGFTVVTPKLEARLMALFEQGAGPRAAQRAVAKLASYGTVHGVYQRWKAGRAAQAAVTPVEPQQSLPLEAANEPAPAQSEGAAAGETAPSAQTEPATREPTLAEVVPSTAEPVQHLGSWLALALLGKLGIHALAAKAGGDKAGGAELRAALDATAVALCLGEGCVEGVRRLETGSVGTLLRRPGGISASYTRRVLHDLADGGHATFQDGVASLFLARAADDGDHVFLYVDNHMRPYTGLHVIRKGWRMQAKRAVPGVTDYYVHDEDGCPLYRMSTASHDSLCDWLMPVVDFARLSLGEQVTPVLVFDRGGAFPAMMAELRDAGAEFVTYERKPYAELPANDFPNSLSITTASHPGEPVRVSWAEAPSKNLRGGRGRVRRIAVLTEDGRQVNVLAVSKLPADMLIRRLMARWGAQENALKHQVERWGINHLDGRRVEAYPPDAVIPNPDRRRLERVLKLSHTAEGEALRRLVRMSDDDPGREDVTREVKRAMERQKDLMAQRASVPRMAKVGETSLAGKLQRHELAYKNVLDTLRTALANVEADLAVLLARHLDRPREAKKLLATLFAAPGTVQVTSRSVTVKLMPAGSTVEQAAYARFLDDVTRLKLSLPGDPDGLTLRWALR
jgi:transposase-like protein